MFSIFRKGFSWINFSGFLLGKFAESVEEVSRFADAANSVKKSSTKLPNAFLHRVSIIESEDKDVLTQLIQDLNDFKVVLQSDDNVIHNNIELRRKIIDALMYYPDSEILGTIAKHAVSAGIPIFPTGNVIKSLKYTTSGFSFLQTKVAGIKYKLNFLNSKIKKFNSFVAKLGSAYLLWPAKFFFQKVVSYHLRRRLEKLVDEHFVEFDLLSHALWFEEAVLTPDRSKQKEENVQKFFEGFDISKYSKLNSSLVGKLYSVYELAVKIDFSAPNHSNDLMDIKTPLEEILLELNNYPVENAQASRIIDELHIIYDDIRILSAGLGFNKEERIAKIHEIDTVIYGLNRQLQNLSRSIDIGNIRQHRSPLLKEIQEKIVSGLPKLGSVYKNISTIVYINIVELIKNFVRKSISFLNNDFIARCFVAASPLVFLLDKFSPSLGVFSYLIPLYTVLGTFTFVTTFALSAFVASPEKGNFSNPLLSNSVATKSKAMFKEVLRLLFINATYKYLTEGESHPLLVKPINWSKNFLLEFLDACRIFATLLNRGNVISRLFSRFIESSILSNAINALTFLTSLVMFCYFSTAVLSESINLLHQLALIASSASSLQVFEFLIVGVCGSLLTFTAFHIYSFNVEKNYSIKSSNRKLINFRNKLISSISMEFVIFSISLSCFILPKIGVNIFTNIENLYGTHLINHLTSFQHVKAFVSFGSFFISAKFLLIVLISFAVDLSYHTFSYGNCGVLAAFKYNFFRDASSVILPNSFVRLLENITSGRIRTFNLASSIFNSFFGEKVDSVLNSAFKFLSTSLKIVSRVNVLLSPCKGEDEEPANISDASVNSCVNKIYKPFLNLCWLYKGPKDDIYSRDDTKSGLSSSGELVLSELKSSHLV